MVVSAMFTLCTALLPACASTPAQAPSGKAQRAVVERVVDGDTVVLSIGGEPNLKVRLISVDAPESIASDESRNCEEGRIASRFLKDLLRVGSEVYVTSERSDRDKYGRLLRHVWLADPDGHASDEVFVRENMVEAVLVSAGMAQAKRYEPDTVYYPLLEGLGEQARASGAGVSYKFSV